MAKYRLNKAERVQATISNVAKTKIVNGKKIVNYSNFIKLVPDKVYETDDEAMIGFFKAYRREVRYNAELERALKENDVPFELKYCKSCGGKIKKIRYPLVEVIE